MTTTEQKIVTNAEKIDPATENRYKAVRSVKNRFRHRINRRIALVTGHISRTKDPAKLVVHQAKLAAYQDALKVLDES